MRSFDRSRQCADLFFDDVGRVVYELREGRVPCRCSLTELVDREPDWRQRVLDLVRETARELLPSGHLLEVHDAISRLGDLLDHSVEAIAELGDFVVPSQGNRETRFAFSDALRREREACDSLRHRTRKEERRDDGDAHEDRGDEDEREEELT